MHCTNSSSESGAATTCHHKIDQWSRNVSLSLPLSHSDWMVKPENRRSWLFTTSTIFYYFANSQISRLYLLIISIRSPDFFSIFVRNPKENCRAYSRVIGLWVRNGNWFSKNVFSNDFDDHGIIQAPEIVAFSAFTLQYFAINNTIRAIHFHVTAFSHSDSIAQNTVQHRRIKILALLTQCSWMFNSTASFH